MMIRKTMLKIITKIGNFFNAAKQTKLATIDIIRIIISICTAVPAKPGEGSQTEPANQQGQSFSSLTIYHGGKLVLLEGQICLLMSLKDD